jgi:hypothetical protein
MSRKEAKQQKAHNKMVEAYTALVDSVKPIDMTTVTDTAGIPTPVAMDWPVITKNAESSLYSEQIGSSDPSVLIGSFCYLNTFKKFSDFLSKYQVPIYHIDYEENTDMRYDRRRGHRAPYVESIYVKVWTYAAKNTPVVHFYEIDVDSYSRESAPYFYRYSYSQTYDEYEEDSMECVMRMVSLA